MKKKSIDILLLAFGIALMAGSFILLKGYELRTLSGVCLGLGAGLLGRSISNLLMLNWYKKHPKELKQAEIDCKDERNELIRNKAKAKCSDIVQWVIMAAAWVTIFADFPIWITLLLVGIFILKNVLELYLMSKYSKEM